MRLLNCHVRNFGSYAFMSFNFSNQGLALIHGATGSGKSTLQDIPAWILYGITAKDGNVDEVRSWNSPNEATFGSIEVETFLGDILVTRIRGKAGQNDLYWREVGAGAGADCHRGKDIADTQKRLIDRLGVSSDSYLSGAYFHEFSATGTFFTAKAKDRRALFESIAPLARATTLDSRLKSQSKSGRSTLLDVTRELDGSSAAYTGLQRSLADARARCEAWGTSQLQIIETLRQKAKASDQEKAEKVYKIKKQYKDFEAGKAEQLEELIQRLENLPEVDVGALEGRLQLLKATPSICPTCKGPTPKTSADLMETQAKLTEALQNNKERTRCLKELEAVNNSRNPYHQQALDAERAESQYESQISSEVAKSNPFDSQVLKFEKELADTGHKIKQLRSKTTVLQDRLQALSRLQELTASLRGEILRNTVKGIETQTNDYLERFFDSEFRVGLTPDGSDDLEVTIHKNGNECVYRQLSKGQRQLLKLCFVTSVMSASANHAGTHFGTIFLDEALDGLDTELKVKAFGLLQELEKTHESVLVIDHNEDFKALFDKRYHVRLAGDTSTIEEQRE